MKFTDEGIIISQKKYGENSSLVKIFSREHGIYRGFVKSAKSKKAQVVFQIGNLVSFEFRTRIEENLGSFVSVDLMKSYCSKIMFEQMKLNCVNSLFALIDESFLEHEVHKNLFENLHEFLQKISDENVSQKDFLKDYVHLELKILKTLGYGIDLSSCAVTDSTVDLAFVSPKSGRAVSFEIGKPYQNKLLKLPDFLLKKDCEISEQHLLQGLDLSGFFLERFFIEEKSFDKNKQKFFYRENIKKALLK
jgi:DNA repair protein RecO (recombination protein O)